MRKHIISLAAIVVSTSVGCGKSVEDRPPPFEELPPTLAFGTQCGCSLDLSPAAANAILGTVSGGASADLSVDACLFETGVEPTLADVEAVCDRTESYVKAAIEEIATARTGFGDAICASGVEWIENVTCDPIPVAVNGTDQDVRLGGLAKRTDMCETAYDPDNTIPCQMDPTEGDFNCQVTSLDVQAPFDAGTCDCNTVDGCDMVGARLERQPIGNADDPPPHPPFGPHGPLTSLIVGRKDGVVNDGQIYISHRVEGCVGPICAGDTESDTSNVWGDFRVYGGPCPGTNCQVMLEMNLAASDMHFDFGLDTPLGDVTFESHTISELTIYLGSGELSVPIDASGNAVVPAGHLQHKIYWKDNGTAKQAVGWFDEEVEFHVDWSTRTVSIDSLDLDLGLDTTRVTNLYGTFGNSLFEKLDNICPAPQLEEPADALALACTTDSDVKFTPPELIMGCVDTPTTVTGEVISTNGTVLSTPIPIVDGEADVPRGSVVVRWIATDSQGRTDQVEQAFQTMARPALAASVSLNMGDRFSVLEPSGVDGAVLNFGVGPTVLNVEGRVAELLSASQVEFRDRSSTGLLLSPFPPLRHYNGITIASQRSLSPAVLPFPEYPSLAAATEQILVGPDQIRTLAPGSYGKVTVHGRGRLVLTPGDYSFTELDLQWTSHLDIQNGLGDIQVVVSGTTRLQSSFNYATGSTAGFTLTYLGIDTVYLESQYKGTLLAPNGTLNFRALNGLRHEGEFYAKNIKTEGGAQVRHVPSACE